MTQWLKNLFQHNAAGGSQQGGAPAASIIIATYNRAEVLRYAILSVVQSDFADWELIVIGDGCTDNTEEVVKSFGDKRITYENLPENSGGQAAPNNRGIKKARGQYVFFLNHDDMYFADHLTASIKFLEESDADIIWSPVALLKKSGRENGPPRAPDDVVELGGAVDGDSYDPNVFVIASSWAMRRETCLAVGEWSAESSTRLSPSQEWLFRASKSGLKLRCHPYVSVLCIHAGVRRLSYAAKKSPEHERAWGWVRKKPRADQDMLMCIVAGQGAALYRQNELMRDHFEHQLAGLSQHHGVHPTDAKRFFEGLEKGEWIDNIRRFTSEAPVLALNDVIEFSDHKANAYLTEGWHFREKDGRWTSKAKAAIIFKPESHNKNIALEIEGLTSKTSENVTFFVNEEPVLVHDFRRRESVIIPVGRTEKEVRFEIGVSETFRPCDIGLSGSDRQLGFKILRMKLIENPEGGGQTV